MRLALIISSLGGGAAIACAASTVARNLSVRSRLAVNPTVLPLSRKR